MIASLPMYDRPETAAANDRLWAEVHTELGKGPKQLVRGDDVWHQWQSDTLLLSQTCGYPYRAILAGEVTMIGTPVYDIDCPPGQYFSVFVVREDDPREVVSDFAKMRFAYNEPLSQSGWAAPQTHACDMGFAFSNPVQSGAHVASARMVAEGAADIAALDAISWAMMQRWDGFAAGLRVIDRTAPTPGLPLITAKSNDPNPIFNAVTSAIASLDASDRETLLLSGLTRIDPSAYMAIPNPPSP